MDAPDQHGPQPRQGRLLAKQYRLDDMIGEGGMGAVYRGQQLSVGRPVAIKLIAGKVAENPECVRRFRREAESMAKLGHPNTVRLFDFGVSDQGELFMVMELLEGGDLAQHLTRHGRLSPVEALAITRQVLEALSEAHALGVVHRDLKPANIFLAQVRGGTTVAKVMDFGIAGIEQGDGGTKLTMTGAIMGTPAYMSPEQAQGQAVDARSDLYSLGVVLFEMLTGKLPFEADSAVSLLLAQVSKPPPRLLEVQPDLPGRPALQALLDLLLDKNPERRPASARAALELVQQLGRYDASALPAFASGAVERAPGAAQSTRIATLKLGLAHKPWAAAGGLLLLLVAIWALWSEPRAVPGPPQRPLASLTPRLVPASESPARAAVTPGQRAQGAPAPGQPSSGHVRSVSQTSPNAGGQPSPTATTDSSTSHTASRPPPARSSPARPLSARERREALLRRGPTYRNVASAKRAYRSGQLSEEAYEDTIWVLKTQRSTRILAEKLNYKRGLISRDEYGRRVDRIDAEYEGR